MLDTVGIKQKRLSSVVDQYDADSLAAWNVAHSSRAGPERTVVSLPAEKTVIQKKSVWAEN